MVSDHPPRLVTTIIFALVVQRALASAIPRVQPESESHGSDAENTRDLSEPQSNRQKTTDKEEMDVLIEFYPDENREGERANNDDPDRYSYKIINTLRSNDKFPIQPISYDAPEGEEGIIRASPDDNGNTAAGYPVVAVKDSGKSRSEEAADSVLQWKVNRPTELEDIVPGFSTWPKHIPEHLRPISPFPDNERGFKNERNFYVEGRQTKRDEAFVPSEKFPPPPRAGPYLYPQPIIGREFEVPFY